MNLKFLFLRNYNPKFTWAGDGQDKSAPTTLEHWPKPDK